MANLTRDQVLQALRALSETDRTYVLAQLASSVSTAREASPGAAVQTTAGPVETTPDGLSELHKELASYRFAQGRFCPHCQSHEIVRFGKTPQGTQRFRCKDCGKTFTATSKTVFSHVKRPELIDEYLACMENHLSLRKAAKVCGIALSASFALRHRILDTLSAGMPKTVLDGITEADETYLELSFKGNHSRSQFKIPRDTHKRGHSSVQRGHSLNKVCVVTGIDRESDTVSVVSNLGVPTKRDIQDALTGGVEPKTVLCTDMSSSYQQFAKQAELSLIRLKGGKVKRGIYHIQNVNQYHRSIKEFLRPFHGVATKYLSNYLTWHRLFAFRVGKRQPIEEASRLLDSETCPTVTRTLPERPAIPISSTTQRPKLNELMKQMVEKERYARAHLKKNVKPTTKSTPDWDSPTPVLFEDVPF